MKVFRTVTPYPDGMGIPYALADLPWRSWRLPFVIVVERHWLAAVYRLNQIRFIAALVGAVIRLATRSGNDSTLTPL